MEDTPVDVVLQSAPMGVAIQDATAGSRVAVATRAFTSSEDGEAFIMRLEGLPNQLLTMAAPTATPSTIDHLVAIIRRDLTTRVFINECTIEIRARMSRSIEAGEDTFDADVVDMLSLYRDRLLGERRPVEFW